MLSEKEFQVLLTQYRECLNFIRGYSSMIWQIPSLTMAINSFLVIAFLGYAKTSLARILILSAALLFTSVSTVQLEKHRFFQEAKINEFNCIQDKLKLEVPSTFDMKFKTETIFADKVTYPNIGRSWIRRQKAFSWLTCSQYLFILAIGIILVIEIFSNFYSVSMTPK